MKARRPSTCPTCRKPIEVGSEITKFRGKWVHQDCAEKGRSETLKDQAPTETQVSEAKVVIDQATEFLLGRGAPVVLDDRGFNQVDYRPSLDWADRVSSYRNQPDGWTHQAKRLWKYRRQMTEMGIFQDFEKAKKVLDSWVDHLDVERSRKFQETRQATGRTEGDQESRSGSEADRGRSRATSTDPSGMFVDLAGETQKETRPRRTRSPQDGRESEGETRVPSPQDGASRTGSGNQGPLPGFKASLGEGKGPFRGRILVRFPYDPKAVSAVKSVEGRRFDGAGKFWHVPVSSGMVLAQVLEDLGGGYVRLASDVRSIPGVQEDGTALAAAHQLSRATSIESLGSEGQERVSEVEERLSSILPDGFSLYPFQKVAVAYLASVNGRGIIGDEMGTGKTIETLAFLAHEFVSGRNPFPAVIIVPAVLKRNWERESRKWLSKIGVKVAVVDSKTWAPDDADVVIINYDIVWKKVIVGAKQKKTQVLPPVKEIVGLPKTPKTVVLDEFHKAKNLRAKRTQASLSYAAIAENQLLLSGTPLLNRPVELFPGLHLLRPESFGSFFGFAKRYCDATNNGFGWDFTGSSNLDELRDRMKGIMLRRKKEDVLTELPPKNRVRLSLDLSNRDEYDRAEKELLQWLFEEAFESVIQDGGDDVDARREGLRKEAAAKRAEHLVRMNTLRVLAGKGKSKAASDWVLDFFEMNPEKKLVVFAHHHAVIDFIEEAMNDNGLGDQVVLLTGKTDAETRQANVDRFQTDPTCRLFICSTMAGGVGLTLTAAEDLLFLEREWVPGDEEQAEDRCHRIGTTGSVTIYYAEAENTIDEDFAELVDQKRAIFRSVMGDQVGDQKRESLLNDVTKRMVSRHQADAIAS